MNIRTFSPGLCLLMLLTGCISPPRYQNDFFAGQDEFAATRERELLRFSGVDRVAMLAHVTDSLLDLDCSIRETNKELGIISGGGGRRLVSGSWGTVHSRAVDCAGHQVTVLVSQRSADSLEVRASFTPTDQRANEAFQLLLKNSIAQAARE